MVRSQEKFVDKTKTRFKLALEVYLWLNQKIVQLLVHRLNAEKMLPFVDVKAFGAETPRNPVA